MVETVENKKTEDLVEENAKDTDSNKVYEVSYLLLPTIPEESLDSNISSIKKTIEDQGGSFISEEWPKMIDLAYRMTLSETGKRTHFSAAYFGWVKFELSGSNIAEIKKALIDNNNVLRHLIIETVAENTLISMGPVIKSTGRGAILKEKVTLDLEKSNDIKVEKSKTENNQDDSTKEEMDKEIEKLVIE